MPVFITCGNGKSTEIYDLYCVKFSLFIYAWSQKVKIILLKINCLGFNFGFSFYTVPETNEKKIPQASMDLTISYVE
jgi:hypothetical protein